MASDDSFDRNVRRMLGQPEADELIDAAAEASGTTPRQLALARVRAMAAYLSDLDDELSHPPVRALPDEEPLYRLAEIDRLWERFYELYRPEPQTPSVVALLELVEDAAAQIEQQERQLAQLQQEMRDGVIAPSPLRTLAESLGNLLREKLRQHDFKQSAMSDAELGALVLLWPRERGSRNDKGKNKWEAACRLARDAGFVVQSPKALAMEWSRRDFRRLSDGEIAKLRQQMWQNIKNTEHDHS